MVLLKCLTIFIVIFIKSLTIYSHRVDDLSKLVKDVIENERVPLIAQTCWSKTEKYNFFKRTSIPIQFIEPNATINLPINEYTNKQWFFVDMMNCEQGTYFLMNIDNKYFAHPYRWIIVDSREESIKNLPFLPDSHVILANHDDNLKQTILQQGLA